MDAGNFYTKRNGEKLTICKKCLTMHVDNFQSDTYLWILEKLDIPYIPEEWNVLLNRAYARDPSKITGMSVIGKYISKMKLNQWKDYSWADSEQLQKEGKERAELKAAEEEEKQKQKDAHLRTLFDAGIISESEYKTRISAAAQAKDRLDEAIAKNAEQAVPQDSAYNEQNFLSEEDVDGLENELTHDDKIKLAIKWGRYYKPSEWVFLEKKYAEMKNSFDVHDSDTESTLILICKTYLKMNQAIDCGDIDSFQKLSRVYESTRKSAKFTAAQNKEEKAGFASCIGELVAFCEREQGRIPRFETTDSLDTIDTVIKDLKAYNKELIESDVSLAQQIEDYLKKKMISEELNEARRDVQKRNLEQMALDEKAILEHKKFLQEQRQKDEEALLKAQKEDRERRKKK